MKKPMPLKVGDLVTIAAPARKVTPDEVLPAIKMLESWGLNVLVDNGIYQEYNQFAGTDEQRAEVMQRLLDNRAVKAIFCARGGYGTVRIVDRLDFSGFSQNPKWIVGYSDITVLHSHIERNFNIPTLHATMPLDINGNPSLASESMRLCLFNDHLVQIYPLSSCEVANRVGECTAPVVGGNLSVLYSLLGSQSDIDTDGKILLIEDLDEYLYHVDRMVMALYRAGKFKHLKGLLVGAMSDMHDNVIPFGRSAEQIVRDAVAEYSYPVAYHCPIGHIKEKNMAMPLGIETNVRISENELMISF